MATRINIMKLLQETRGFAEITNRRPQDRTPEPVLLHGRSPAFRRGPNKRKWTIQVDMQNTPDIPHPVKIRHVREKVASVH